MRAHRTENAYTLPELLLALVMLAIVTGATVGLVGQLGNLRLENSRATHAEVVGTAASQAAALGFDALGTTLVTGSARDLGSFSIVPRIATVSASPHRFSTVAGGYVVANGGGGGSGPGAPLAIQTDIMPLLNASENDTGALLLSAASDLNWTTADPSLRFRARVTSTGAVAGADYTLRWTVDGSDPDASDPQLPASSWSLGNASPNPDLLDAVAGGAGNALVFTLKVRALSLTPTFGDSNIAAVTVTLTKVAPVASLTRSGTDTADVALADVYTPAPSGANRLRVAVAGLPESIASPALGWVSLTSSVGSSPIGAGALTYSTDPSTPAAGALVTARYDATPPVQAFTTPGASALWSVSLATSHPLVNIATAALSRTLKAVTAGIPDVDISPATGTFTAGTTVSITSSPTTPNPLVAGVANQTFLALRYTLDGSAPASTSSAYSTPFTISESLTVRAANVPATTYAAFFGTAVVETSVLTLAPTDFSPLYLRATGVPSGSLTTAAPTAKSLANHDPKRDSFAGLLLAKGAKNWDETDATKHQRWLGPVGALVLSGPLEFRFWSAMKDFSTSKRGSILVYLIDRDGSGKEGKLIASGSLAASRWSGGSTTWVLKTVSFGTVDYKLGATRRLELCLIVENSSDDDMWFAYDAVPYASVLGPPVVPPPASVAGSPSDREILSGGTTANSDSTSLSVGNRSSQKRNALLVFDISEVTETVTSAELSLYYWASTLPMAFNIDLWGVGWGTSAASAPVSADYLEANTDSTNTTNLVKIADNLITPSSSWLSTPKASGSALVNYLNSARAAGATHVFFRLNPDAAPANDNYVVLASGDYEPFFGIGSVPTLKLGYGP
jgi:hypothetical protein